MNPLLERAPWEETSEIPRQGAVITDDDQYRFVLTRWFDELNFAASGVEEKSHRHMPIIMHNCSVAGALTNDHTIRKVCGFAHAYGWGGIVVGNLYGARSTDPKKLFELEDPVGMDNDVWLARIFAAVPTGGDVYVAWGALKGPKKDERIRAVVELADRAGVVLKALKVTNGNPHHPLRLAYDSVPVLWRPLPLATDPPAVVSP